MDCHCGGAVLYGGGVGGPSVFPGKLIGDVVLRMYFSDDNRFVFANIHNYLYIVHDCAIFLQFDATTFFLIRFSYSPSMSQIIRKM